MLKLEEAYRPHRFNLFCKPVRSIMHLKILECLQTSKVFKRQVQTCEVLRQPEIRRELTDLTGLTLDVNL